VNPKFVALRGIEPLFSGCQPEAGQPPAEKPDVLI